MYKVDKKAVVEALKLMFRVGLFAFASAVVDFAIVKLSSMDPSNLFVTVGTLVLLALDKFIHESKNIPLKGLSPV